MEILQDPIHKGEAVLIGPEDIKDDEVRQWYQHQSKNVSRLAAPKENTQNIKVVTGFRASSLDSLSFSLLELFIHYWKRFPQFPIVIIDSSLDHNLLSNFLDNQHCSNIEVKKFHSDMSQGMEHHSWDFALDFCESDLLFFCHLDCFPMSDDAPQYFLDHLKEHTLVGFQDFCPPGEHKLTLPRISPILSLVHVEKWRNQRLSWVNRRILKDHPELQHLKMYGFDVSAMLGAYLQSLPFHVFRLLPENQVRKKFLHVGGLGGYDSPVFVSRKKDSKKNTEKIHDLYMSTFKSFPTRLSDYRKEKSPVSIDDIWKTLQRNQISIQQNAYELEIFFKQIVRNVNPSLICEIGSYCGGSLYAFSKLLSQDGTIISIDYITESHGLKTRHQRVQSKKRVETMIRNDGLNVRLIENKSETAEDELVSVLDGRFLDVLFIDGDHHLIEQDFHRYSKYVRKGGIVGFHDTRNRHYPNIRDFIKSLGPNICTICGNTLDQGISYLVHC